MSPVIGILARRAETSGRGSYGAPDAFVSAIQAAGGAPLLIPTVTEPEVLLALLDRVDGLLITGGGDVDPARYGQEPSRALGHVSPTEDEADRLLVEAALERPGLPLLGVCRGIQSINVFAGGTLIQDIAHEVPGALKHQQQAPEWYGTHEIAIEPDSLLQRVLEVQRHRVNSYHHQAVREAAPGWRITARAADGVVEAVECETGEFRLGVQFHPEHMAAADPLIASLFGYFVAAAHREFAGR